MTTAKDFSAPLFAAFNGECEVDALRLGTDRGRLPIDVTISERSARKRAGTLDQNGQLVTQDKIEKDSTIPVWTHCS